jgi:hypothetical protein
VLAKLVETCPKVGRKIFMQQSPKMLSLPPRIPRDQAARLPWPAILALFSLQHIRELERHLDLPTGTITRAWSTSPAARGLSAKVHLVLLKGIASQFSSSQELRGWMRKHWPVEWWEKSSPTLGALYASNSKFKISGAVRSHGFAVFQAVHEFSTNKRVSEGKFEHS